MFALLIFRGRTLPKYSLAHEKLTASLLLAGIGREVLDKSRRTMRIMLAACHISVWLGQGKSVTKV
jgi:hypothetical protein